MGNVIDFLERVGGDASLRHGDGYGKALRDQEFDDPERAALAGLDADALRLVLKQGIHLTTQMGEPFGPEHERELPPDDDEDGDVEPGGVPPESLQ